MMQTELLLPVPPCLPRGCRRSRQSWLCSRDIGWHQLMVLEQLAADSSWWHGLQPGHVNPVHHLYCQVRVPTGSWRNATVWCTPAVFQQRGSGEEVGPGGLGRSRLVRDPLIACSSHVTGKGTAAVCPSTWCHCKALGGIMAWKDAEG